MSRMALYMKNITSSLEIAFSYTRKIINNSTTKIYKFMQYKLLVNFKHYILAHIIIV